MVELKIGKRIFEITENDIVLFNGACWQLITQKLYKDWNYYYPVVSKALCEKFVKKGILVMFKKEKEYKTSKGEQMGLYYYKFDIENLSSFMNKQ